MHQGFRYFWGGLVKGPILQEENLSLRNQIQTLQAHEETHRQLFEENARLKSLLGLRASSPWHSVPAQVIGRQRELWSRTILIDQGVEAGIRPGMPLLAPGGLVGRMTEVGSFSSRAVLLNDPHFRVSALISENRTAGLVVGTSSGDCLLTYIPRDSVVKQGQTVVTAGGKSFCPAGVIVGSIQSVITDPSALFQSAKIRPRVPLAAVEEVLVVIHPSENQMDE